MRRSSGDTPLLAVPSLAGGDGVDDTAAAFLVRQTLLRREEEERKEKEKEQKEKEAKEVQFEEKSLELSAKEQAATLELDALLLVPFERRTDQEMARVSELRLLLDRLGRARAALLNASFKRKRKKRRRKRT